MRIIERVVLSVLCGASMVIMIEEPPRGGEVSAWFSTTVFLGLAVATFSLAWAALGELLDVTSALSERMESNERKESRDADS